VQSQLQLSVKVKKQANLGERHEERLLLVSQSQIILVLQCKSVVIEAKVMREGISKNFHQYVLQLQLLNVIELDS
jgi:hypothetical protein